MGGGGGDVLLTTLSGITQCACLSDSVFHADREEADRNRFSLIKKMHRSIHINVISNVDPYQNNLII